MPITVKGLEVLQRVNTQRIKALQPQGKLGGLVQQVLLQLHAYMVVITHRLSGALAASERVRMEGLRGEIFIDPGSVNPMGQRPAVYGPFENARGGEHAFIDRTVMYAPKVSAEGVRTFLNEF